MEAEYAIYVLYMQSFHIFRILNSHLLKPFFITAVLQGVDHRLIVKSQR